MAPLPCLLGLLLGQVLTPVTPPAPVRDLSTPRSPRLVPWTDGGALLVWLDERIASGGAVTVVGIDRDGAPILGPSVLALTPDSRRDFDLLSAVVEGDHLRLAWGVDGGVEVATVRLDGGAVVRRDRIDLEGAPCLSSERLIFGRDADTLVAAVEKERWEPLPGGARGLQMNENVECSRLSGVAAGVGQGTVVLQRWRPDGGESPLSLPAPTAQLVRVTTTRTNAAILSWWNEGRAEVVAAVVPETGAPRSGLVLGPGGASNRIASLGDGAMVTWDTGIDPPNLGYDLRARFVSSDGQLSAVGALLPLAGDQYDPEFAALTETGGLVVAEDWASGDLDVLMAWLELDDGGTPRWTLLDAGWLSTTVEAQRRPRLAWLPGRAPTAAWSEGARVELLELETGRRSSVDAGPFPSTLFDVVESPEMGRLVLFRSGVSALSATSLQSGAYLSVRSDGGSTIERTTGGLVAAGPELLQAITLEGREVIVRQRSPALLALTVLGSGADAGLLSLPGPLAVLAPPWAISARAGGLAATHLSGGTIELRASAVLAAMSPSPDSLVVASLERDGLFLERVATDGGAARLKVSTRTAGLLWGEAALAPLPDGGAVLLAETLDEAPGRLNWRVGVLDVPLPRDQDQAASQPAAALRFRVGCDCQSAHGASLLLALAFLSRRRR